MEAKPLKQPTVPVRCSRCKKVKPDTAFGKDMSKANGLTCWCKDCIKATNKRIYAEAMAIIHPGQYWDKSKRKWFLKKGKW